MKVDENLVHYIKSHQEEEIAKGMVLLVESTDEIVISSKKKKHYFISVPSQSSNAEYIVSLNILADNIEDECACKAFEKYGGCKHCIAAALYILKDEFDFDEDDLDELTDTDDMDEEMYFLEDVSNRMKRKVSKPKKEDTPEALPKIMNTEWKQFELKGLMNQGVVQRLAGNTWSNYNDFAKLVQKSFDEKELHWIFNYQQAKNIIFVPEIRYNAKETYYYRCNCSENKFPACKHVRSVFDKLANQHGPGYFMQFKNWDEEKNKFLEDYGITIEDEDSKLFRFSTSYYGDLLVQAPQFYIKPNDKEKLKQLHDLLKGKKINAGATALRPPVPTGMIIDFEAGLVINLTSQRLGLGFELEAAKVYTNKNKTDVKKLSINQPGNLPLLRSLADELYEMLLQLSDTQLLEYLSVQGYSFLRNYANPWQQMSNTVLQTLTLHYIDCLNKIWPLLAKHPDVFLLEEGKFSSANCKPVNISADYFEPSFTVTTDDRFIIIKMLPAINGEQHTATGTYFFNFLLLLNNTLHIIKNKEDVDIIQQFKSGFIKLPVTAKLNAIQSIISPLQERYQVQLPGNFDIKTITVQPQNYVLLKEFDTQYLMVQPCFDYEGIEVEYSRAPEDIVNTLPDGFIQIIKRDAVAEKKFFEELRLLHNSFGKQQQNDFFFVHFNEVMKGNWFVNTVRHLQESNITVKGMQELKRLRYNTHKPVWEMKTGSGIDWFDLQITISFGEQQVALKDVRKALLAKQNIVVLGDGSFGVLPEEWIEQYGMLLKMGDEQKDGSLRLNKLHFTVIDEMHQQIDDEEILKEIEVKKQKLRNVENVTTILQSEHIKASLRPYQVSGFQWLQTLDELGWGGCLADDMGLGKTLQAITFLQYIKEKYKGSTSLVVCPTSLIFNWENELQKFAPQLRYHIYYGSGREFTEEHFESYDIVITSYGLVRIDMEQLLRFEWYYVILDESQAIKNPDAQTTRAVQLLKSKNRLILSGTPVQNNTYDLYAQFNFINPGLLGNKEFFKSEFATPIDKYNDADKSRSLRKLVYPFLLRRTKEQVAKDLPDKTETILWCQLLKEQRSVYEDYKNYYRGMLLKKIEEEGMAKAGMYVLEGLLRLRQVCDSPQLLKDEEVTTTQSIKTEELLREIEENTGNHKLLVFSQFTEMLRLIENALQQKNIKYCYLDGSTPAEKRKEQVESFQSNSAIKVFLISLKAGGVGLNLTAADYVYIVDPWWNPAAEQQAIDRTHRIGQTKKIFAYKMICKNTVEEKILELQQRKKQLANELVTEDAGFIKKLTKEDVTFLFS